MNIKPLYFLAVVLMLCVCFFGSFIYAIHKNLHPNFNGSFGSLKIQMTTVPQTQPQPGKESLP